MSKKFLKAVDSTNEWVGKITAFLILIMVFEVVIGVIARYVFNNPFMWSQEVACFIAAVFTLLGGGYALLHKAHVRVDFVFNRLPIKWKARADLFTSLLFFFFAILIIWEGADMAWNSIQVKEHLAGAWHGPIYPFKIFVPIAGILLLLQGIAKFIRDLTTAKTGKVEEGSL
jgi:TRAP-type mannitol/chloroaromatic compound transport system permease small subunit